MQLFDYQKEGIAFTKANKKVYLAFDMGMGKTITSIAAAEHCGTKHILLVAEKHEIVNSENFKKEVESYFPNLQYLSLRENDIPPLPADGGDYRFVCGINPDALSKLDQWVVKEHFDTLVMDEATLAKTTTTIRFKSVRKIAEMMEYVILLSGTPMMNGASELFAPLILLEHPLAGDGTKISQRAFETIFAGGFMKLIKKLPKGYEYADLFGKLYSKQWQYLQWWAKGANNVRELRAMIDERFFFKRKAETNVFKKKIRTTKLVEMTPEWEKEYQDAWDTYLESVHAHNISVENYSKKKDLDNIRELQKLIENGQMYQVNSRWKARRVVEDIKNGVYGNQRIVVFSIFMETDEIIQSLLKEADISFRTFDEVQDWKIGSEQVLVGRIKSHAKGSNVPEASVTLFVDMDFVPTMNLQAENRMDRPEQKNDMLVVYYCTEGTGDIDKHVRKINQDKMRKIEQFMKPFEFDEMSQMAENIRTLHEKYPKEFRTLYERHKKCIKVFPSLPTCRTYKKIIKYIHG